MSAPDGTITAASLPPAMPAVGPLAEVLASLAKLTSAVETLTAEVRVQNAILERKRIG